ncbi:MAG: PAS domain S-box protein [Rhodospirillales bacterium]|nr:PAS domain S-box protein [Acetobacter sp.]
MNATQGLEQPSLIDLDEPNLYRPAFASFEYDVQTGLTYWTSELHVFCGLSAEVDLPLDEHGIPLVFSPADRAHIRARFRTAAETQDTNCLNVEVRLVCPDGDVRWLQLLGHPFSGCGRHRLSGVLLDITERKHIDQCHARLLREQAIFADFSLRIRDVTDINAACDLAAAVLARSLDVTFTKVFEMLPDQDTFLLRAGTGWPAGFVGVARASVTSTDLASRALHFWRSVFVNNAHNRLVLHLPDATHTFEVRSSMVAVIAADERPFGVIGVDTTEPYTFTESEFQFLQSLANVLAATITRIRLEEARQREDRFTATVLNTSAALITVTDRAGKLVRFSPACERTTGYKAECVLGRHLGEFVPKTEHDELSRHLAMLVDGAATEGVPRENHWVTRGGERRLISWSDTVLHNADGRVEYFVSAGLDITERKRLEQEILATSEREQRRIGQDLHDDLGQRLTAIQFLSENLCQELADATPALARLADRISSMSREANDGARMIARGLCPGTFDAAGLVDALHVLARNTTTLFRIQCKCHAEHRQPTISPKAAIQLYRIAQEAVGNAVRHSKATEIVIEWHLHGRCELSVVDNGTGFPVEQKAGEGMGLRSMRYRASLFQGHLCIHSQAGSGTRLTCEVPSRLCHLG